MASFSQKILGLGWRSCIAASLMLLAGCGDVELPHVLGSSEVPDSVLAQPRVVATPDQNTAQQAWPRLGDVPEKPKDFSSPSAIEAEKEMLRDMRDEARQDMQEKHQ